MLCSNARLAHADDVEIHVERFGAFNAYRGADVTALRVRLRSDLAEPTSAIVQWDVENADGDMASNWREVTLPPGQNVTCWLYAKLPAISASSLTGHIFDVSVFQAQGARRIRPLGTLRFTPAQAAEQSLPLEMDQDAIALVGDGKLGLEDLGAHPNGFSFVPSMNSFTQLPRGMSPTDIPDRWEGLWSFNEIIWSQASPQLLTGARATALRDWIARGGSLVVVLPESGNPWALGGGTANFLSDLLPTKGVIQVDGVSVETLLPALSRAKELRRANVRTPVYMFDSLTLSKPWKGLIAMPETAKYADASNEIRKWNGRGSIVVRRSFGYGSITLIGVDIDALHHGAYANESLPQVDVFWNRILGRRADSLSANDFDRLQKNEPKRLAAVSAYDEYDCGKGDLVINAIGLQGRVASGVLATLVLFVVYWLAACPIAWWVLRKKKLQHLAWLVFVGVSLLACAAAYGLGGLISTTSMELRHLTVLDSIDEPANKLANMNQLGRATMWMSALLPGFTTAEIAMESQENQRNILTTWASPTSVNIRRFPDSTRFDQPIDDPMRSILPARATTSDFEARWLGEVSKNWGTLPSQIADKRIKATATPGNINLISLTGSLTHHLPGALKNVILIHVSPFQFQTQQWSNSRRLTLLPSAPLANAGRMVALANDWLPNQELNVAEALYPKGAIDAAQLGAGSLTQEILNNYTRPLRQLRERDLSRQMEDVFGGNRLHMNLQMLSLYQMLQPPAYEMNPPDAPATIRMTREIGRSLDISLWLTQPCLIVTGMLEDVKIPVPINVADTPAKSGGSVLVRYIIPLPDDAAIFWPPLPVP
ncbi:MAG: hypothetical protein EXS12_07460 [Phycisphaerales bacterium]|nr:hypothetical protein [Phycisphaerales bacterium]